MGLHSSYENPDPEEEAEIFGVPGLEWLTQNLEEATARREAELLGSEDYGDLQEDVEEREWTEQEQRFRIETELTRLSDEELSKVTEFIQELLGSNEDQEGSQ